MSILIFIHNIAIELIVLVVIMVNDTTHNQEIIFSTNEWLVLLIGLWMHPLVWERVSASLVDFQIN